MDPQHSEAHPCAGLGDIRGWCSGDLGVRACTIAPVDGIGRFRSHRSHRGCVHTVAWLGVVCVALRYSRSIIDPAYFNFYLSGRVAAIFPIGIFLGKSIWAHWSRIGTGRRTVILRLPSGNRDSIPAVDTASTSAYGVAVGALAL